MAGETIKYLTNNQSLKAVADAIRAKGGTDALLEYPAEFVSAIQDIPTGGGSAEESDVNFYDYDGTLCASYSAADFASLRALPANPAHEGLTAQGWNWSLANAKAYVAKYGKLNIGQMYITDDGKTRVYIHLEEGRTSPMLGVCPNGTVDVDWGDGTTHDTLTGTSVTTVQWTPTHNYADPGDYIIKLTVTGSMGLYGEDTWNANSGLLRYSSSADTRNHVYRNAIKKVEIGANVTNITDNAFTPCYGLSCITIPNGVTNIGKYAFNNCYHLSSAVIPDSVESIAESVFSGCHALSSASIPDSITSIGNYAFSGCESLSSITIPDTVTSIGNGAFSGCYLLSYVTIPDSVTSIGNSSYSGTFGACYILPSITFPDSLTSIGGGICSGCNSLSSITIPNSVTNIGSQAFNNCYSAKEYHILPTTPPTLANTNAFQNIPADCIMYVPSASLEAYKTANNWSTYASYMQGE